MNAAEAHGGAAAIAPGAGLVPSKTSLGDLAIDLSRPACADRRIKRLKKSVWASGHLHGLADHGKRPPVCWFVTLTYVGVKDWRPDHISRAIQSFRNWCASVRIPCRYTWVAELQSRGAVHYHLLAWLPQGLRMPQWDKPTRKRNGMRSAFWPHGMTNTQVAKSGVGYLMKYLSKLGELTIFPKGLRLYGIGGLDKTGARVRSWLNLPEWVKRLHGVGEVVRSAGRLLVPATGELLEACFAVSLVPGRLIVHQLRELPPRFHSGPYSTFPRVV